MRGPRYLSCEGDFVVVIDGDTRDVSTDSAFFHDMDPCSLAVINPSANTPASPSLLICFDRPNFCRAPSRLLGGDLLMIRLWCAPLCRETVRVHESWRLGRRRVSGGLVRRQLPVACPCFFSASRQGHRSLAHAGNVHLGLCASESSSLKNF